MEIRKVITLIVTVTYMMMLCSKFIALIAITLGVLFAFIKSHAREAERGRERERENFASLQKTNCQTRYKILSKECTELKTHITFHSCLLRDTKESFCNLLIF